MSAQRQTETNMTDSSNYDKNNHCKTTVGERLLYQIGTEHKKPRTHNIDT